MAKLFQFKRIVVEDFDKDDRGLITKLAYPLNLALESMFNALNKNLTLEDNFNAQVNIIELNVDENGTPRTNGSFRSNLKTPIKTIKVGRAQNLTNPNTYPTTAPWISYSQDGTTVTINNISGLQSGNNYRLTIESLG